MIEDKKKIYNGNMVIINKGFRGNQPIALVERILSDNEKDYFVAFNYEINNDKLEWGYSYYYYDNIKKADKDYKKVIAGGNLSHTFDKDYDLDM